MTDLQPPKKGSAAWHLCMIGLWANARRELLKTLESMTPDSEESKILSARIKRAERTSDMLCARLHRLISEAIANGSEDAMRAHLERYGVSLDAIADVAMIRREALVCELGRRNEN